MSEPIDYEALLAKYMAHVVAYEGVDFVEKIHAYSGSPRFTDEEIAALRRIAESV